MNGRRMPVARFIAISLPSPVPHLFIKKDEERGPSGGAGGGEGEDGDEKYPLQGVKLKNFGAIKKVALLMQNKAHLTSEGLEEIRKIKSGMNKQR